jgi:hypothetical protein
MFKTSKSPVMKPKSKRGSKGSDELPPVMDSSQIKPAKEIDHTLDVEAVREDALREVSS